MILPLEVIDFYKLVCVCARVCCPEIFVKLLAFLTDTFKSPNIEKYAVTSVNKPTQTACKF